VDVTSTDGKMLADGARRTNAAQTVVYDEIDRKAENEVQRVIAANLGRPSAAAAQGAAGSAVLARAR
jgi:membrane fusion protein (multidrug efflux system)